MDEPVLVALTTIQGASMCFGPYPRPDAERVADTIRARLAGPTSTGMVVSPARSPAGRPAGVWAIPTDGIARIQVIDSRSHHGPVHGRLHLPDLRSGRPQP